MAKRIEPALTAEEWAVVLRQKSGMAPRLDSPQKRIAMENAALPDSDPRKITRETVEIIRAASRSIAGEFSVGEESDPDLDTVADALESYLPPT